MKLRHKVFIGAAICAIVGLGGTAYTFKSGFKNLSSYVNSRREELFIVKNIFESDKKVDTLIVKEAPIQGKIRVVKSSDNKIRVRINGLKDRKVLNVSIKDKNLVLDFDNQNLFKVANKVLEYKDFIGYNKYAVKNFIDYLAVNGNNIPQDIYVDIFGIGVNTNRYDDSIYEYNGNMGNNNLNEYFKTDKALKEENFNIVVEIPNAINIKYEGDDYYRYGKYLYLQDDIFKGDVFIKDFDSLRGLSLDKNINNLYFDADSYIKSSGIRSINLATINSYSDKFKIKNIVVNTGKALFYGNIEDENNLDTNIIFNVSSKDKVNYLDRKYNNINDLENVEYNIDSYFKKFNGFGLALSGNPINNITINSKDDNVRLLFVNSNPTLNLTASDAITFRNVLHSYTDDTRTDSSNVKLKQFNGLLADLSKKMLNKTVSYSKMTKKTIKVDSHSIDVIHYKHED